jgi:hypothetical protein
LDREAARERDKVAARLGYPFEDGEQGYYQTFYNTRDELRFSSHLLGEVIGGYKERPLLFVRCLGQNVFNFWFAGKTLRATAVNMLVQFPYLALAVIGTVFCIRNRRIGTAAPIVLFIVYVVAVHAPILAQARYSIPLMPLLCILGTLGIASICQHWVVDVSPACDAEGAWKSDEELTGAELAGQGRG